MTAMPYRKQHRRDPRRRGPYELVRLRINWFSGVALAIATAGRYSRDICRYVKD